MTSKKQVAMIEKTVAGVIVLIIFALSLFLIGMIGEFQLLFEGFGGDLPALTVYAVQLKYYLPVLVVFPVIGFIVLSIGNKPWGWFLVAFGGFLAVVIYPISLWAMYLPVFEMGKVVGG